MTTQQNATVTRYSPTIKDGLNLDQVTNRKAGGLVNFTNKNYSKSYFNIFYNNIFTFFNLLGLIVFIALLCVDAPLSNFFFVLIFFANIVIGITQEIRAKHCINKLSLVSSKSVKVVRDSEITEIIPSDIVLDDIIVLSLGNQIPTDSVIADGEVEVNESLLTGESDPVKKKIGDSLLAGSYIVAGKCFAKAEHVGAENYVQKLSAKAKQYKKPQSELMNSLKAFIKYIGIAIVPIATLFLLKSTLISKVDLPTAILKTSTVIIGMIPSGMMLLTSLALAIGIIKLATHNTLVQDLYSLEMLARVDTICFDKTGTITDGKMTVSKVEELNNDCEFSIKKIVGSMLYALKDNNQTAIALQNYFGENNELVVKNILPFNSKRKLSAVTFDDVGTFSFGAPEFILDKEQFSLIENKINDYAKQGLRVLALAFSNKSIESDLLPNDFKPIALITLVDHIREDAYATVKWFKENGVAVKVISGDNPVTVAEVSRRVGIDGAEKYISLEGLTDEEVCKVANEYTVFGRVTPEQKAILVKSMKAQGHVTAMTGDGVNDILALKEADCAISVASGSDAARNISHIVLMDNNFNSMPKVVYEGRRVINNIQSSASLYLMKTFFTMLVAIITMSYLDTYPFKLSQMILLEVFVIGVPSFFLSLQANDRKVEGKFIRYVIQKSLPSAVLMVFSFFVIEVLRFILKSYDENVYVTLSVYAITLSGVINLFIICRPLNFYRSILFSLNFGVVLGVFVYAFFNGLSMFALTKLTPISTYYPHVLTLLGILIIDFPVSILFQKIFKKIKIENIAKLNTKETCNKN